MRKKGLTYLQKISIAVPLIYFIIVLTFQVPYATNMLPFLFMLLLGFAYEKTKKENIKAIIAGLSIFMTLINITVNSLVDVFYWGYSFIVFILPEKK